MICELLDVRCQVRDVWCETAAGLEEGPASHDRLQRASQKLHPGQETKLLSAGNRLQPARERFQLARNRLLPAKIKLSPQSEFLSPPAGETLCVRCDL